MDFITGNIKKLYFQYLFASMGSALVMSIYSFVDTIAVGQSEGPVGTAAMAVVTPVYGILIFLAILCGVGGSVLMTQAKAEGSEEKGNAYFTASLILMGTLIAVSWVIMALFHEPVFRFFGADDVTMPKVWAYAKWQIRVWPLFLLPTFISAFIRNDGAPGLAMGAVITGGAVNMFGDWFFCFPMGMGMEGAAIATVIGTLLQVVIMCSHFFRKKCKLRLVMPYKPLRAIRKILAIGFGSSLLDLSTVVLSIMLNNQLLRYGGTAALSVYGIVGTISSLVQALFCGVGQAVQPLVSANYGAQKYDRTRSVLRMSMVTVGIMGVLFAGIGLLLPEQIVKLFTSATPEVLEVAPLIVRGYFLMFLFLGVNALTTYYLQSTMKGALSMVIAVLRGFVFSGILLFTLPLQWQLTGVCIAMPISEGLTAVISAVTICKSDRKKPKQEYT